MSSIKTFCYSIFSFTFRFCCSSVIGNFTISINFTCSIVNNDQLTMNTYRYTLFTLVTTYMLLNMSRNKIYHINKSISRIESARELLKERDILPSLNVTLYPLSRNLMSTLVSSQVVNPPSPSFNLA